MANEFDRKTKGKFASMARKNVAQRLEEERMKFLERGKRATGRLTANQTGARPLAQQRVAYINRELGKELRRRRKRAEEAKPNRYT